MKKTILCLLSSLLLLFPILSLADTFPCPHYPGQYVYEDLLEVTRVDPDIGVDGWVELACPECGQVVETFTLLALVPEADHPASSDDEIVMDAAPAPQSDPDPVAEPDPVPDPVPEPDPVPDPVPEPDPVPDPVPDPPAQPEAPVKVEAVAEPAAQSEAPQKAEAAAESPAKPEAPAQPEAAPVRAAESEAPVKAEALPETESSAGAEVSAQSENPLPQAAGTETAATAAADAGGAAQQAVKADPPKAQDVTANVAPQQTGGTAGGGGSTGSAGRKSTNTARVNAVGGEDTPTEEKKNIRTFPYRRVRMKPRPGIRAEAAGILLWPAFGTPFQSLYND